MEYNEYEYDLDENIEIEDFGGDEEFFGDPANIISQTKQDPQPEFHQQLEKLAFYERKSGEDEMKILELDAKYNDILIKYNSLSEEFSKLKTETDHCDSRDKTKQLEERVLLIKDKAKEKLAEKEDIINELNEKIKNYDEMLNVMEVNCKQAVVKFNEFEREIAKKDELLKEHFSFKNRYDYTVNYLTEKCQKITETFERRIQKMEERLRSQYHPSEWRGENVPLMEAIEELDNTIVLGAEN